MKAKEIWVVEAHDLGALQVRAAGDALILNRKKWLMGIKADRLLVGIGETIDEALEVERELKRMRKNQVSNVKADGLRASSNTVRPLVRNLFSERG